MCCHRAFWRSCGMSTNAPVIGRGQYKLVVALTSVIAMAPASVMPQAISAGPSPNAAEGEQTATTARIMASTWQGSGQGHSHKISIPM